MNTKVNDNIIKPGLAAAILLSNPAALQAQVQGCSKCESNKTEDQGHCSLVWGEKEIECSQTDPANGAQELCYKMINLEYSTCMAQATLDYNACMKACDEDC